LLELHLLLSDGSSKVYSTDSSWQAYDADVVYNPRNNSGCAWYYYPQENFDASHLPPNTPLSGKQLHGKDEGLSAAWQPAVEQPMYTVPLEAKSVAPISVLDQPESSINVTGIGPGRFFVDLGRNIQGGVTLALAAGLQTTGSSLVKVQVTVAEELNISMGMHRIMYPPRTTINPRLHWTLDAAHEGSKAEHHEYLEFRYVELLFDEGTALPRPIGRDDFSISAWIVRLPYSEEGAASMTSSSKDLNAVWELCRYTIEVSEPRSLFNSF
jgi:alpha-L-rhamnosidase